MTTIENAKALLWDDEIGSLEPGKRADLLVLDLDTVKFDPVLNTPANIVYQATADDVETVFVDGDVVVDEGELLTVDERSLRDRAQDAIVDLFDRADLDHLAEKGLDPWTNEVSFS